MKKFIALFTITASLGGCAALNLSPAQQANLQLWIQAGKTVIKASTTIYCQYEPATSKLISIFDTSKNTATNLAKLDQATVILCNVALANAEVTK